MPDRAPLPEVDEELLALLDQRFADLAGPSGRIDAVSLQKALGLSSPYLARRMLAIFDHDRDGSIDRGEFLGSVRRLVRGSERDKLVFVFQLHDDDGDGAISQVELERMIALSLAEDQVTMRPADARELSSALFRRADRNRDGRITFDEFEAIVRAHPQVLDQLVRTEARWIAPNEDLLARLERPPRGRAARVSRLLRNHASPVLFLCLWVAANVALFASAVIRYQDLEAHPLVQVARGCGACLNFNGALILVPMMRRLLTWVRKSWLGVLVPVDDAIAFHRLVGNAMLGFAFLHTGAHLANYALVSPSPFLDQLFLTRAGLSGLLLLAVFSIMGFFARQAIRQTRRFELFYRTHLLYLAWLALALVHGPVFWMWASAPIAGFAVEQLLRLRLRGLHTHVVSGQALRSGVTRLELARPKGFAHRPGDYLFIRIPAVAAHEWHPFTISSAPERGNLTLHVRSLGNWTTALRTLIEQRHASGQPEPLIAHIDGPYGTASSEIFASRYAVLIGAGIGVTPFASVLESISLTSADTGDRPTSLRKAYFFWLNRDQYSFEWFASLLARFEGLNRGGLLDIHTCMTGGRPHLTSAALHLAREVRHEMGGTDIVTGLRTKTTMGAPDWETWLATIARRHAPERVDVYFCGPHGLASLLRPLCKRLGMRFRQEHF